MCNLKKLVNQMWHLIYMAALVLMLACTDHSFAIPDPVPDTEQDDNQTPEDDNGASDDENQGENEGDQGDQPSDAPTNVPIDEPSGSVDLKRWPVIASGAGRLVADGADAATYTLITKQGYNYETPDHSGLHASAPLRHISQHASKWLGRNIFAFHIHAKIDDDRGKTDVKDRQRNEIKTDAKSPASMVAQEGETLEMRWKFMLPKGMVTTDKFCHIHQLKGIDNKAGTADVSMPMITFTARSTSKGQQFQVIFVPPTEEGGGNQYLAKVNLSDFLGEWVAVTERVTFAKKGVYSLVITRMSDGKELVRVNDTGRNFWRTGTTGMRPKWGIYRSVGSNGSLRNTLRDEVLLFADFEIEKP